MEHISEILTELIAKVEGQCDCAHTIVNQIRKDTISTLQTIRHDVEDMETQQALDNADKVNDSFKFMLKSLGMEE